jgi:type I restriction enzyme S subunit
MNNWPLVKLSELLRASDDWISINPSTSYREVTVRLWGRGVVQRGELSGSQIAAKTRLRVHSGEFIFSRIDARNGALGVVPKKLDGAVVSGDFPTFVVDHSKVLAGFLGWLCKTHGFVDMCRAASEGTTNRVRVKEDRLLASEIALPPIDEQRRIVSKIESVLDRLAAAQSLSQQAGQESVALVRSSAETAYRTLGEEYGFGRLEGACVSITDGDHNTPAFCADGADAVKFIFVGNVSSGRLHFESCKRVNRDYFQSLQPARVPRKGDVLYSAVGATLGIPAVVDTDDQFCFQRHIAILKPDHARVSARFVWHMLRSESVFRRAWESTTGSAQPTIPLRGIRSLLVPVPPREKQAHVVARLDALQAKLDELAECQSQARAGIRALLPAILARAFRGEL